MAAPKNNTTYADVAKSIKSGNVAPVYLLHGEDSYYTDRLTEAFIEMIPEGDRDFNLTILYGTDVEHNIAMVTDACHRYPMMADRQVVILREAQVMRADAVEKLAPYVARPSLTTVFVIVFRGAKAKGRELQAALRKSGGVSFESVPLKETQIPAALTAMIKEKGLSIEPKGCQMLAQHVGTDLARLYNEVTKLATVLGAGAAVTPEAIERNIGISKDYNNFELQTALAARDAAKVFAIAKYFRSNPKSNPTVLTTAMLFSFFSNLLIYKFHAKESPSQRAAAMGVRWVSPDYDRAAANYNARQVIEIIAALRDFDRKSKGQGSRYNEYDLQHDLFWRILTARGETDVMPLPNR